MNFRGFWTFRLFGTFRLFVFLVTFRLFGTFRLFVFLVTFRLFGTFRDFSTFRFSGDFSGDFSGLFDFSFFWWLFDFSGLFGTFRLFVFLVTFLVTFRDFSTFRFSGGFSTFRDFSGRFDFSTFRFSGQVSTFRRFDFSRFFGHAPAVPAHSRSRSQVPEDPQYVSLTAFIRKCMAIHHDNVRVTCVQDFDLLESCVHRVGLSCKNSPSRNCQFSAAMVPQLRWGTR